MPRKRRIDIPGILQHVIGRGIEKREIFKDDKDRQYFINNLGEILIKNKGCCYGWVLMPNHFHLVLMSGNSRLSILMRKLLTKYAIYFNQRYKRSGYLFQNRYKSIVCDKDTYLQELIRYVHLNPIRGKIIRDLNELSNYKWSGHRTLIGKEYYKWYARKDALAYFGKNESKSIIEYIKYMQEGLNQKVDFDGGGLVRSLGNINEAMRTLRNGDRQMYDERILGDGEFVENILKNFENLTEIQNQLSKNIVSIRNLIKIIAEGMRVDINDLKGNRKNDKISKARSLISYIGQTYMGANGNNIGLELNKGRACMSIAFNRGKELIEQDSQAKVILNNILTFKQRPLRLT